MKKRQCLGIRLSFLLLFFFPVWGHASTLDDADHFFSWLNLHAKDFAVCEPKQVGSDYVLCDETHVPKNDLKKMFAMTPAGLIAELKSKGIKIELICAREGKPILGEDCQNESSNKMFSEITALHGKYLPVEKTILIRNSATLGSLIHEYVHYLQSENTHKIFGKVYKPERNKIQADLTALMDKDIAKVQALEKAGKKSELKPTILDFQAALEKLHSFAPWQDLIDERGIFLLYLKYGKEFGAADEDFALARKNMGFVCNNPKLEKLLPKKQCVI